MPLINTALTLKDLPPPPLGKTGWPWTEQTEPLPERMPDGSEWPPISVVTPSYNQGQFIEETIRSVLLQGYPNLEYIIMDGGSTDSSVEIIRKYESWLTYWISQPDKGQTDAIQKGFNLSTGVVWNWLNSDDLLEPNALTEIAWAYINNPSATIYSGDLTVFGNGDAYLHPKCFNKLSELVCIWEKWPTPQPSVFLSSSACQKVNGLDISIRYAMDYEIYLRLAQLPEFKANNLGIPVAKFRLHSLSKTSSQGVAFKKEILQVFDTFASRCPSLLPNKWRRSRARFTYHLAINHAQKTAIYKLRFTYFIRISAPFILDIWNYRFFWGYIFSYLNQLTIVRNKSN
jgi:glycosyltransferase involved in cell wall biosynthesis